MKFLALTLSIILLISPWLFSEHFNINSNSLNNGFDQKEVNAQDSLAIERVLKEAIAMAKENIHLDTFYKEYAQTIDSSFNLTTRISLGHLFSKKEKHLVVEMDMSWAIRFNIYRIRNGKFEEVIQNEQHGLTFLDQSSTDVNGDGLNDFLVHWYPMSGCCRRDIYDVYLGMDDGDFSKKLEFINPTFSPREELIRGVLYGHPGEVGLYKYKWVGFEVDTVEYIYPNPADSVNRSYIRTKHRLYSTKNIEKEKLSSVPLEYHKIDSFEWFNDY